MDYEVMLSGSPVGKARLERQGLYCHVVCRCDLPEERMYRLELRCGEKQVDLGILVPRERGFGLDTRFPANRLGEGEVSFSLRDRNAPEKERRFLPVREEEPFEHIEELEQGCLEIREGQMGVSLPPSD